MVSVRRAALLVALGISMVAQLPATAAAANGSVEGEVVLPPGGTEEPPPSYLGFVSRIRNPITELRPYDPRDEAFVYLEGGNPDPEATKPPRKPVIMKLGFSVFMPPLMPVVVGSTVSIRNVSRRTHPVYTPDGGELGEGPPIGAEGERDFKVDKPFAPVRILSKDTPHLDGRVVAVPTKYFARIERDGKFLIEDVPPGKWTLRVWYRDGWLPTRETVEVATSKTNQKAKVRITLPERLDTKPPEGGEK